MQHKKLFYFIDEGLKNIVRNSSITIISIALITISIFIIGMMFSMFNTMKNVIGTFNSAPSMVFFLKEDISISEKEDFMESIKSEIGIIDLKYISKDNAYNNVKNDETIKALLSIYGKELLPESIAVHTKSGISPDLLESLYNKYSKRSIVDTSFIQKDLSDLVLYLKKVGFVIFLIFSLLVVLIIGNAIRLSVFAKRNEIYLKRLLGSTETFIRFPFMIEGILKGLISGIITNFIFAIIYLLRDYLFPNNLFGKFSLITPLQGLSLIIIGGIFGWLGSIISTKLYIRQ
jgi:cell division transport system permease protein